MKWVIAGLVITAGLTVGAAYYGWQTIEALESDVAALESTIAEMEDAAAEQGPEDDPALLKTMVLETIVDALTDRLEDLERGLGSQSFAYGETVWDVLDDLRRDLDAFPAIQAPPPIVIESPPPVEPTQPTVQWCAEFQLALETAGNEAARAQGLFGMNNGMYQEWVIAPLEATGCELLE